MATPKKLGDVPGVSEWENLETAADTKRLFAWCIRSIRNRTIDPRTAAIMAQIGSYLLKAVEAADFERRLDDLEKAVAGSEHDEKVTGHAAEPH